MLVHALALAGVPAELRATGVVTARYVDGLELEGVDTVYIGYFSRDPDTAVRGFVRRLRRRWPDVRIILALWNAPDGAEFAHRAEALGVDQIVLSMDEAVRRMSLMQPEHMATASLPASSETETARLKALAPTDILDGHARENLDELAARASDVFDVSFAFISALDANAEYILGQSMDLPGQRTATKASMTYMPRAESLCSHVVASNDSLVVPDTERDPRFSDNQSVRQWQGRFYASVPLRTLEGHVLGALSIVDRSPRQIEDAGLDLLDKIAADVVAVMTKENAVAPEPRREEPAAPRSILGQRVPD